MPDLKAEIDANCRRFEEAWFEELNATHAALQPHEDKYEQSYARIASLNAWRSLLLDTVVPPGPRAFFVEAQNDAISSHVFARLGSWRAALKFLRSCIENVLFSEFYRTHLVEHKLWELGKHRIGFSEMLTYFQGHPDLLEVPAELTGLDRLSREYSTLSRAVHGSSSSFRMTDDRGQTNIWNTDPAKLGAWVTRERNVLLGLNLLLLALHREALQGAALPGLRQTLALTITTASLRTPLRTRLGVNIPDRAEAGGGSRS